MVGKGLSIWLNDCHLLCLRVQEGRRKQKVESVNDFFNSFVGALNVF